MNEKQAKRLRSLTRQIKGGLIAPTIYGVIDRKKSINITDGEGGFKSVLISRPQVVIKGGFRYDYHLLKNAGVELAELLAGTTKGD